MTKLKISKQQFIAYEAIRRIGVTNMLDVRTVQRLARTWRSTRLTTADIREIIANYNVYAARYLTPEQRQTH